MALSLKKSFVPVMGVTLLSGLLAATTPFNDARAEGSQDVANANSGNPPAAASVIPVSAPANTNMAALVPASVVDTNLLDGITVIDPNAEPRRWVYSEAQDASLKPDTIGFALKSNDAQTPTALNRAQQIKDYLARAEGISLDIYFELNNDLPGAGATYYIHGRSLTGTPYDVKGAFGVNGMVEVVLDDTLISRYREAEAVAGVEKPNISGGTVVAATLD